MVDKKKHTQLNKQTDIS